MEELKISIIASLGKFASTDKNRTNKEFITNFLQDAELFRFDIIAIFFTLNSKDLIIGGENAKILIVIHPHQQIL